MNVKAYQTQNLSIVFAEVRNETTNCCGKSSECGESGVKTWEVRNPMALQMVPDQSDPTGQNLIPTLFPVFFTQIMTVEDYDLDFPSCEYVDISDRFVEAFFENYRNLNTSASDVKVEGQDDEEKIVIFEK